MGAGDQPNLFVLVQHATTAQHRRRPAVLKPLGQHAIRLLRLGRSEREAVVVVRVEELAEVAFAVALVSAVTTCHDELLERDAGPRHKTALDVRRNRRAGEDSLEDLQVDVAHLEHWVVLGDDGHVGVDERVVRVVGPLQRVARLLEYTVQLVQHDRVEVAHVAEGDGRKRDNQRKHLDRHLLRERVVLAQKLSQLDAEEAHGDQTDEHPEEPGCGRLGPDQTRHAVHARARGEPLKPTEPVSECKKTGLTQPRTKPRTHSRTHARTIERTIVSVLCFETKMGVYLLKKTRRTNTGELLSSYNDADITHITGQVYRPLTVKAPVYPSIELSV